MAHDGNILVYLTANNMTARFTEEPAISAQVERVSDCQSQKLLIWAAF